MLRTLAAALAGALLFPLASQAQPAAPDTGASDAPQAAEAVFPDGGRRRIGYGRLITNDLFGDGEDRWRTGSVASSRVWGYGWDGRAPQRLGELLELRLHGQIIAPERLSNPAPGDRPWAGALSAGLHSHAQRGDLQYSLGADLVMTGPQTGLDGFQKWLHDLVSAPKPSDAVLDAQIPDSFRPTLVAETGQSLSFGDGFTLRPFAEARAGDETLVRMGADLTVGGWEQGSLLMRDPVTGHRYKSVYGGGDGVSFVLGGDVAYVSDSIYLPESRGYELTSRRDRLRAGVHWQSGDAAAFYGLTYLGEEFEGQDGGQLTGSIRLRLRF